jgi:hypothetical protein
LRIPANESRWNVGFVIGFFLGVVVGLLLQPAVVMLIAKRAHAASGGLEADDDFKRVVISRSSAPLDAAPSRDARSATRSS